MPAVRSPKAAEHTHQNGATRGQRRQPYLVAILIVEREVWRWRAWFNHLTKDAGMAKLFGRAVQANGRQLTAVLP